MTATLAVGGPKLTDWFPPGVKPVRVGVYQVCEHWWLAREWHSHGYQHWDGQRWGIFNPTPDAAAAEADLASEYQINFWRGLAEQPAA